MKCDFCSKNSSDNLEHDCWCLRKGNIRIAWGICCAKKVAGISNMKEEDYHDNVPWRLEEDCTCK